MLNTNDRLGYSSRSNHDAPELSGWSVVNNGFILPCTLTAKLSDAGGPERPHWKPTPPARIRSSDLVSHETHVNWWKCNHL